MKKLLTIHGHGKFKEVLLSERMHNLLGALRDEYGNVSVRPTREGLSVYVPNWLA